MFPKYIILPDTSKTLTIASAKVTRDSDDNLICSDKGGGRFWL